MTGTNICDVNYYNYILLFLNSKLTRIRVGRRRRPPEEETRRVINAERSRVSRRRDNILLLLSPFPTNWADSRKKL